MRTTVASAAEVQAATLIQGRWRAALKFRAQLEALKPILLDCMARGSTVPAAVKHTLGQKIYDAIEGARRYTATARKAVADEVEAERLRYAAHLRRLHGEGSLSLSKFAEESRAEGIASDRSYVSSLIRGSRELSPGEPALLSNLKRDARLNGEECVVLRFDEDDHRYEVEILSSKEKVRARAYNVSPAGAPALKPQCFAGSSAPQLPVGRPITDEDIHFWVRSAKGRHTPLHLHGLKLVRRSDGRTIDVAAARNIPDSGSSTVICGIGDFEAVKRELPGAIRRLDDSEVPADAVRLIQGIGGTNAVLFHCEFTLNFGGCLIHIADCPVLHGHSGFLFGNDVAGESNMRIKYERHVLHGEEDDGSDATPKEYDGTITLHHKDTSLKLGELPFTHRVRRHNLASAHIAESLRDPDSGAQEALDKMKPPDDALPGVEELIHGASPIAFSPRSLRIPAWSESFLQLRVPVSATEGYDLALLPLEDERLTDLGILIAPTLQRADKRGYVTVRVINPHQQPVVIPPLTPVARFVIDPKARSLDVEFEVEEILARIHLPGDITEGDRHLVRRMLVTRRRLFATTLGWTHTMDMSIKTPRIESGEVEPPADPARRLSPPELKALREAVDKQLKLRLIEPVVSPYCAQPMLIPKATGGYRVVVDWRKLNKHTERDTYPLPNIDASIAALGKAKLFSTCDLLMGFHQVELNATDGSREKTAFWTPWGQFAYNRMPMGLTSSPGAFMRIVDAVLRGLPPGVAVPFVDDVLTATDGDFAAHMHDVGMVFDRLSAAGFRVVCEKVWMGMKEVPFLGFKVGGGGHRPQEAKLKPILDLTYSLFLKDPGLVPRFAGMINFYQSFIPHCQYLLGALHDVKNKAAVAREQVDTLRFRASFAALLQGLVSATALARPDFSIPFYVDVDSATVCGVGSTLSQRTKKDDARSHKPIAFWSTRFSDSERGWPVRDQECFGLVESLLHWRHYLLGAVVIVRSDHQSLQWLMTNKHREGSRVQEWSLRVQQYDLHIEYVPGSQHIVPDFLSRVVALFAKVARYAGSCDAACGDGDGGASGGDPGGRAVTAFLANAVMDTSIDATSPCVALLARSSSCKRNSCAKESNNRQRSAGSIMHATLERARARRNRLPRATILRHREVAVFFVRKGAHSYAYVATGTKEPLSEDRCPRESPGACVQRALHSQLLPHPSWAHALDRATFHSPPGHHTSSSVQAANSDGRRVVVHTTYWAVEVDATPLPTIRCKVNTPEHGFVPLVNLSTGVQKAVLQVLGATSFLAVENSAPFVQSSLTTQAALILVRKHEANRADILLEVFDGTYGVPVFPLQSVKGSYKSQLVKEASARFDSPELRQLLPEATLLRRKQRAANTVYFALTVPSTVQLELHSPSGSIGFVAFEEQLLKVLDSHEVASATAVTMEAVLQPFRPTREWHQDSLKAIRKQSESIPQAMVVQPGDVAQHSGDSARTGQATEQQPYDQVPAVVGTLDDAVATASEHETRAAAQLQSAWKRWELRKRSVVIHKDGPALCTHYREQQYAVGRIRAYLAAEKEAGRIRVVAVDLEGLFQSTTPSVSLLQVSTGARHGAAGSPQHQLTYALDILKDDESLRLPSGIRSILEDGEVIKVFHNGYNDFRVLHYQFGIIVKSAFDSGIADAICSSKHRNTVRGLAPVMKEWAGASSILQHKGAVDFSEVNYRPMSHKFFVYSCQDVLYCVEAFWEMRESLLRAWMLESVLQFSEDRVQCAAGSQRLRSHGALELPVEQVATILMDADSVLCLRDRVTGVLTLPTLSMAGRIREVDKSDMRAEGKQALLQYVPENVPKKHLPPGVALALGHLRRGYCWLGTQTYLSDLPDASVAAHGLTDLSPEGSNLEIVAVDLHDRSGLSICPSQETTFQYALFEQRLRRRDLPAIRSVNVVTGKVFKDRRAAVIIHDGTMVHLLKGSATKKDDPPWFPQLRIEIGVSALDTAVRAMNAYVGPAAFKPIAAHSPSTSLPLLPRLSQIFIEAMSTLRSIGEVGNTEYFECRLSAPALPIPAGDRATISWEPLIPPRGEEPLLKEHWSSFAAARVPHNGFRLAATSLARNSGIRLELLQDAGALLGSADCTALQILSKTKEGTGETVNAASSADTALSPPMEEPAPERSGGRALPPLGENEEFDKLFEARVLLRFAQASEVTQGREAMRTQSQPPEDPQALRTCWRNYDSLGLQTPAILVSRSPPESVTLTAAEAGGVEQSGRVFDTSPLSSGYVHEAVPLHIPESCGAAHLRAAKLPSTVRFICMDQAVELCKASLLRDYDHFRSVLNSPWSESLCLRVPKRQFGKWKSVACEVLRLAAHLKFGTIVEAREALLRTSTRLLAMEAVDSDPFGAYAPGEKFDPSLPQSWGGCNALGWALMVERTWLREEAESLRRASSCSATVVNAAKDSSRNKESPKKGLTPDAADAVGIKIGWGPPQAAEIIVEQQSDPGLESYLEFIEQGVDSPLFQELSLKEQAAFRADVGPMSVDHRGILVTSSVRTALHFSTMPRVVLPLSLRHRVFQQFHDRMGHLGVSKVEPLVTRRYWWGSQEQMRGDIRYYIGTCRACARTKVPHHKAGQYNAVPIGEHPFSNLAADIYKTGLKWGDYDSVVSFADYFSRYIVAEACEGDPDHVEIARILFERVVRYFGMPRRLGSDRGSQLVAKVLQELYAILGIKSAESTAYHHQTIGLVERWHSVLKALLNTSKAAGGEADWPRFLPALEMAYNATVNSTTGYSPFFIVHGRHCVLPTDAIAGPPRMKHHELPQLVRDRLQQLEVTYDAVSAKLRLNAIHAQKVYDLKRDVVLKFKPGDSVLVLRGEYVDGNLPKSELPTMGPFTVAEDLGRGNYRLTNLQGRRIHDVVHVSRIIPYPSRRGRAEYDPAQRYPIKSVIDKRISADGTLEYKVHWLGWPRTSASWRDVSSLFDIHELIEAYEHSQGAELPTLPMESRDIAGTAPVDPAAVRRSRFRNHVRRSPERSPAEREQNTGGTAEDPPTPPSKNTIASRVGRRTRRQT